MLQLDHQQQKHHEQHHRHLLVDRGLACGRLLDRALQLDAIVGRQAVAQRLELGKHRLGDVRRLHAVRHDAAHRDGREAIPAPLDSGLEHEIEPGDLPQRHRGSGRRLDIDVVEDSQEIARVRGLAQQDLDGLVAVAELADLETRQHGLQRPAHALRGHAERAGAILIDFELHARHRLEPVVVHVADLRGRAHHIGDLAREATDLRAVRPGHAHLHRPAHRRTVEQAIGLVADVREVARQDVAHSDDQPLARLDRFRHQQQLSEVLVAKLLVEGQVEARCAFADERRDVADVRIGRELLLEALGLPLALLEGRTFRHPQVDQDLAAVGGREKLLRDEGEARHACDERPEGQRNDQPAPTDAPRDEGADRPVGTRVEGLAALGVPFMGLQKLVADPRREIDRRDP